MRNEKVLIRIKEEKDILYCTIKTWKTNWIGHTLRRNYLLKHIIEGKVDGGIKVMGRQGRRDKQLLDDIKQTRGYW